MSHEDAGSVVDPTDHGAHSQKVLWKGLEKREQVFGEGGGS